jgi:hypothetical protein
MPPTEEQRKRVGWLEKTYHAAQMAVAEAEKEAGTSQLTHLLWTTVPVVQYTPRTPKSRGRLGAVRTPLRGLLPGSGSARKGGGGVGPGRGRVLFEKVVEGENEDEDALDVEDLEDEEAFAQDTVKEAAGAVGRAPRTGRGAGVMGPRQRVASASARGDGAAQGRAGAVTVGDLKRFEDKMEALVLAIQPGAGGEFAGNLQILKINIKK